ncbi:MAG: hypothetical protein KKF44_05025, partial [Nanoarchaeota archaeon]|nr:hypothetical protein [Nanoarchaeota archaeon]
MKKISLLFVLAMLAILFTSCTKYEYVQPTSIDCADGTVLTCPVVEEGMEETDVPVEDETETMEEAETEEEMEEETETPVEEEDMENPVDETKADIIVVEGELVKISPKVSDPDGDEIILTFSEPLDEKGEWQTKEGDAGLYEVTITASDGISQSEKKVIILVKPANYPPVIEIEDMITVKEGESVDLEPVVTDPENDEVTVSYSGWMEESSYETTYSDAGEYTVTITASDGKSEVSKDIKVIVENRNRKPELELTNVDQNMIEAVEGDILLIEFDVSDPDDDDVTVEFTSPFDEFGIWQTEEGDAGDYEVTVTASDDEDETSQEVLVIVKPKNQPPVFDAIGDVTMTVGKNLKDFVKPKGTDPEGEDVEITVSGFTDTLDYV